MDNYYFQYKYSQNVEPLYGKKRTKAFDNDILKDNVLPHKYSILDRIDMTEYETYSIDPDGCEDADDAFTLYTKNKKMFLAIHIADPTEYINIESSLWNDIQDRVVTKYPSNRKPIHMIPDDIMEKSSLMVNSYGDIKQAITILTEINSNNYEPINNVQLLFTNIKVKKINAYSYERASKEYYSNDIFYNCIRISEVLKEKRGKKTKGIVLNEVSNSYVKYNNDIPYLYKDTVTERLMKQMIAEFAIFANSFVGEYLRIHFDGIGLYRSCDAKDWLNTVYSGITGQELLNEIIINGIKAEYISNVESHDLVGSQEYCHFTSPIRRLSDCVCHYLLKYIYLKQEDEELTQPFSNEKLLNFTEICDNMTKSTKNIQYKDSKFRLIQTMNNMILNSEIVNITYYISSFTSAFLNIIICGINEHDVYLSYTLRISNTNKSKDYQIKKHNTLLITKVNCVGKFDEGSIPELDALFI